MQGARLWMLRCPLVLPALAVVLVIAWVETGSHGAVLALGAVFCGSFFSRKGVWLLVLLCGVLMFGLHRTRLVTQWQSEQYQGSWRSDRVVLLEEMRYGKVLAEVAEGVCQGARVQLRLGKRAPTLRVGDVCAVEGQWIVPRESLNPAVFDEKAWLYRRGVSAVVVVKQCERLEEVAWWMRPKRWAVAVRQSLQDRLTRGLDPEGQAARVILGMSLGMRPDASDGLLEDFRHSGSIHVFAVSGLHVMMVGGIVALLLRCCGVSRRVWVPCVVVAMLFYALITGMKPSAMRASVMGAIVLGAWLVQRKIVLANSIAAGVVVVLLWEGHLLFQPGFQLSFGVLIAIALFANALQRVYGWITAMDPFLPRVLYTKPQEWWLSMRRKVQAGLIVATAAWGGSAPLTFWHFGLVAPISILASLPLVSCLFVVLLCSMCSLALGWLHPVVAERVNQASGKVASVAIAVAGKAAAVRGGHMMHGSWSEGERVVIYALSDGGAAVYVGIGGGVFLDCGSVRLFKREVYPSLVRYGARVDSLILTHADAAHCGGALQLLECFDVKQVVLPEQHSKSAVYRRVQHLAAEHHVRVVAPQGRLKLADGVQVEILYGGEEAVGERGGVADDRCLVLLLDWRGERILFVNDAGFGFEQWAQERVKVWDVDVVVLGQHCRDAPLSTHFLQQLAPRLVIVEGEGDVDVAHYALQRSGALVLTHEKSGLVFESYREGRTN